MNVIINSRILIGHRKLISSVWDVFSIIWWAKGSIHTVNGLNGSRILLKEIVISRMFLGNWFKNVLRNLKIWYRWWSSQIPNYDPRLRRLLIMFSFGATTRSSKWSKKWGISSSSSQLDRHLMIHKRWRTSSSAWSRSWTIEGANLSFKRCGFSEYWTERGVWRIRDGHKCTRVHCGIPCLSKLLCC